MERDLARTRVLSREIIQEFALLSPPSIAIKKKSKIIPPAVGEKQGTYSMIRGGGARTTYTPPGGGGGV